MHTNTCVLISCTLDNAVHMTDESAIDSVERLSRTQTPLPKTQYNLQIK